jgi:DNA-binding transcriptional MerR regulator
MSSVESPPEGLSVSAAAQATGLSVHTLRYYESAGLMRDPVDRASSSHRRYAPSDLRWIVFLTKLRRTGMPIKAMREYTELVRSGEDNEKERLRVLEAHREAVCARLHEVTENLEAIEYKIDVYRTRVRAR